MRATSITKGTNLESLCLLLKHELNALGFITDCTVLNSRSIKIGLHMISFRVDTKRLGYNARIGAYVKSPKGYKRTDVPTWDQRVQFNDTVNRVFDQLGLQATIRSGCYTVRNRDGAMTEQDWHDQSPSWMGSQGELYNHYTWEIMSKIVSEADAREECDSDRLEQEHREAQRPKRLAAAREKRAVEKAFHIQRYVTLDGYHEWEKGQNGKRVTHATFRKLLKQMPGYQARRIRQASIVRTLTA